MDLLCKSDFEPLGKRGDDAVSVFVGDGKHGFLDVKTVLILASAGIVLAFFFGALAGFMIGSDYQRRDAVRSGHAVHPDGIGFKWLPPCAPRGGK
jgi:hypothetical protein